MIPEIIVGVFVGSILSTLATTSVTLMLMRYTKKRTERRFNEIVKGLREMEEDGA